MKLRTLSQIRLVDGVVVAAVGMLGLKVLGIFAASDAAPPPPPAVSAFGRVFTHARSNFDDGAGEREPATTGSVPDKKEAEGALPHDIVGTGPAASGSPTERALLQRLGERRDELQQRSRDVETREKLIEEQERKLDERLQQAKAVEEARRAGTPNRPDENATLKNLVTMYEVMKPKDAARVFERLPMDVLLSVVTAMNARKMAEVLSVMSAESAEKLTVALARRSKPEERSVAALPPGELQAIEPPKR